MKNGMLIVNADDFGWCESINKGIIEAHRSGVVTSASLLAGGAGFSSAVLLAKANPDLGIGVHLNIYRNKPVLGALIVPTLVDRGGYFIGSVTRIVLKLLLGRIDLGQVEREFEAQIKKVIDTGIMPTHLDSEKHLHHWPSIFRIVCRLANKHNIKFVRLVREDKPKSLVSMVLYILSRFNKKVSGKYDLRVVDSTLGISFRPESVDIFKNVVNEVKNGIVEFVCHPGFLSDEFWQIQRKIKNILTYSRENEQNILADPNIKKWLNEGRVELTNFRNNNL